MKFKKNITQKHKKILRHICNNVNLDTTVKVTEFYKEAPFPNYQGFENKLQLSNVVKKCIFKRFKRYYWFKQILH